MIIELITKDITAS